MPVNHVIDMMRVHCMLLKVLRQSLTGTGYLLICQNKVLFEQFLLIIKNNTGL